MVLYSWKLYCRNILKNILYTQLHKSIQEIEEVEEEREMKFVILPYLIFVLNIWWEIAEKRESSTFKCTVAGWKATKHYFLQGKSWSDTRKVLLLLLLLTVMCVKNSNWVCANWDCAISIPGAYLKWTKFCPDPAMNLDLTLNLDLLWAGIWIIWPQYPFQSISFWVYDMKNT